MFKAIKKFFKKESEVERMCKESTQDMKYIIAYIQSKEIKAAWSKSVNNKDNNPSKNEYGTKVDGNIAGIHYIVYNVLRSLPMSRGFEQDSYTLNALIRSIEINIKWDWADKNLLHPFNKTVTKEQFKEKWFEALRLYNSSQGHKA